MVSGVAVVEGLGQLLLGFRVFFVEEVEHAEVVAECHLRQDLAIIGRNKGVPLTRCARG